MVCYNAPMKVVKSNSNPAGDEFHTIFEDQHDELMESLNKSSSKTFTIAVLTLVATCLGVIISIAALIVAIAK